MTRVGKPGIRQLAVLLAGLAGAEGRAAAPSIEFLHPPGGQAGTTVEVHAAGAWPEWPVAVWAAAAGVTFESQAEPGHFRVRLAPETPAGPVLLRFHTPHGASPPVQFVVGRVPEITVTNEPGSTAGGRIVPSLPVTLNGRMTTSGETDTWLLPVSDPIRLSAVLRARSLDSPLEANLALFGPEGGTLTLSAEGPGRDPTLSAVLSRPGLYVLQVTERPGGVTAGDGFARTGGGSYRLKLRSEFLPAGPFEPVAGPFDTDTVYLTPTRAVRWVDLPATIRGFINPPGDQDVYGFAARAQERFTFRLATTRVGSPLDGFLELLDEAGEVLVEARGPDPELAWVALNAGSYRVRVSDASSGGGAGHFYDLEMESPRPNLEARLETHTLQAGPGDTLPLRLTLRRPAGFGGVLTVGALDLPRGTSLTSAVLPPGLETVVLTLRVSTAAPPANQPFQIVLNTADPSFGAIAPAAAPIQGRYTPAGDLLINETDRIWLTVLPRPDAEEVSTTD